MGKLSKTKKRNQVQGREKIKFPKKKLGGKKLGRGQGQNKIAKNEVEIKVEKRAEKGQIKKSQRRMAHGLKK